MYVIHPKTFYLYTVNLPKIKKKSKAYIKDAFYCVSGNYWTEIGI